MKRVISLTLIAALLAGALSGCGAAKAGAPAEKQPPALVITDADGGEAAQIAPSGYQWEWPAGGGSTQGAVADAIHPLDENVTDIDELWFFEDADREYGLSFSREPSSVEITRWEIDDIGDTQAEPLETAGLTSPYKLELRSGSVYLFHAVFDKENGCGGDSDYYLLVPAEGDMEDTEYEDMPIKELFEEENNYWQTEAYAEHTEAVRLSKPLREDMDAYYTRVLPLLLSGQESSVCSPLNLYLALSMLAEAAGGESRAAILSALNAPDLDTVRRNASLLWAANDYELAGARCLLASSLWLNEQIPTKKAVADALVEHHHAEAFSGVMGTEETDRLLHDWINEKTQDLLKEFVAGLRTQPETVMELVSTMYFKAAWTEEFSESRTDRAPFHGLRGDTECDMMHRSADTVYYWGDGFSAISLPLTESGSMFFFLPDEGVSLESVISDPQAAALLRDPSSFPNQRHVMVKMSIPKFDVKSDTDLSRAMTAMGMGALFDADRADFTPLAEDYPVCLSQTEHAACVTVDEQGVTGAAFTLFGLAKGAMPPSDTVQFVLDRPFMFAVVARDSAVLFAGTVTDLA